MRSLEVCASGWCWRGGFSPGIRERGWNRRQGRGIGDWNVSGDHCGRPSDRVRRVGQYRQALVERGSDRVRGFTPISRKGDRAGTFTRAENAQSPQKHGALGDRRLGEDVKIPESN